MADNVIRIPPFKYVHILDNNTNITKFTFMSSFFNIFQT